MIEDEHLTIDGNPNVYERLDKSVDREYMSGLQLFSNHKSQFVTILT